MDDLRVTYYGHLFDASGYGRAARAYIHALHKAGVTLSVVDLMKHGRQVSDELVDSLLGRQLTPDFHLFHGIPSQWARLAFRLPNAIGMTVWETDTMPTQWRNVLSHVLEVWLPCEFNVAAFGRDLRTPLFTLPHALLPKSANGAAGAASERVEAAPDDFVFYSVFEWQDRKCPAELIEAYLRAFHDVQDTLLIIKTNAAAAGPGAAAVAKARQQTGSPARVVVRAESWSDDDVEALHRRGNCYVSLHRGEGWGYPLFEAAGRGTPVVATGFAGPLDYLGDEPSTLVPYQLTPVRQPYVYYHPQMRWADPDVAQAVCRLRWVYEHRDDARAVAARLAARIQTAYSLDAVGTRARDRLLQILKRTQPAKWARLARRAQASRFSPPIPIPGEWYDEAYFETGDKSNWDDGYEWGPFERLFRETASFLVEMFPDAASFLDAGCAKGFLVRALREAGKECWGFDFSPVAIRQAEPCAKPYITLSGVDDVRLERPIDVLLAFDLLSHLTEAQAESFVARARACTRTAIVATIKSVDAAAKRSYEDDGDRDLSHIMLRSRDWWHALFEKTGWRQDPLHRAAARACQRHPLPQKMGWTLYVYAP